MALGVYVEGGVVRSIVADLTCPVRVLLVGGGFGEVGIGCDDGGCDDGWFDHSGCDDGGCDDSGCAGLWMTGDALKGVGFEREDSGDNMLHDRPLSDDEDWRDWAVKKVNLIAAGKFSCLLKERTSPLHIRDPPPSETKSSPLRKVNLFRRSSRMT